MTERKDVIAVVICALAILCLVACGAEQKAEEKPILDDVLSTSAEGVSDPNAVFVASTYLGLPEQAPPTYWYADTSAKTAPSKSFGLYSSTHNQRVLFVVFDDKTPVENLGFFTKKPPYVTCLAPTDDNTLKTGNTNLGKKNLNWVLVKCKKPKDQFKVPGIGQAVENQEDKYFPVLVGSVRTRKKGKCMLIIGRGYFDDYKYSHDETVLRLENAFRKPGEDDAGKSSDSNKQTKYSKTDDEW